MLEENQHQEHESGSIGDSTELKAGSCILSNNDYHAESGISSTNLKLLEESALHLKNKNLFNISNDNLSFGSLVHSLVLEPEKTDDEFILMPKLDARTKEGKRLKEEFIAESNGRVVVSESDYQKAERMAFNVNAISGGLLKNGVAEQSYFAEDQGLLIKCRPDYYIQDKGIIVDLKTTADISEYGLKKAITNYRYNLSAVFYMHVLRTLGLKANKFIFVFVDKAAPHMVKIRELSELELQESDYEMHQLLDSYRDFLQTGKTNIVKTIESFRRAAQCPKTYKFVEMR